MKENVHIGSRKRHAVSDSRVAAVSGTDDGVACTGVWVAATVQTHCERRTAARLNTLGFDTYVAAQEEIHRWSDRLKKVQRIVIPNIVFVHTATDRLDELRCYSFVYSLLANPGTRKPAIIPDAQVKALQFMLGQSDLPVTIDKPHDFRQGESVRVMRGCLAGLEGIVEYASDGNMHVGIYISDLGFAHVTININDVESIK